MGAEIVLNVVKTATVNRAQKIVLARANAIVNKCSSRASTPRPIRSRSFGARRPEGRTLVESPDEGGSVLTSVIDLNAVPTVRKFGTVGLTRLWEQMLPADAPISLPIYGGRIDPQNWNPAHRR